MSRHTFSSSIIANTISLMKQNPDASSFLVIPFFWWNSRHQIAIQIIIAIQINIAIQIIILIQISFWLWMEPCMVKTSTPIYSNIAKVIVQFHCSFDWTTRIQRTKVKQSWKIGLHEKCVWKCIWNISISSIVSIVW